MPKIPEEKKAKVAQACRLAVRGQIAQWDAEREMEKILDTELDSALLIEKLAIVCGTPEDCMALDEAMLVEEIERLL